MKLSRQSCSDKSVAGNVGALFDVVSDGPGATCASFAAAAEEGDVLEEGFAASAAVVRPAVEVSAVACVRCKSIGRSKNLSYACDNEVNNNV